MSTSVIDIDTLQDFDIFFYYGQNDLEIETKSDIFANLMQEKRSLFYDRSLDSAGVHDYENSPIGISMQVGLSYDITMSLSKRNQYVSNGENGDRDRRIAVSQSTIKIENKLSGECNITVLYIPLADFKQTQSLNISIGINQ